MATPTEPFSHLSLGPDSPIIQMAAPEEVRRRAIVVQDILSSFDDKALPSEIQPGILRNIDQNMATPNALHTDWTIQGNLQGSLLQWGAYNDEVWGALSKLQPPHTSALIFLQKLQTRFSGRIRAYDDIANNPPLANTLKDSVQKIVGDLEALSEVLNRDRTWRQHEDIAMNVEIRTLAVALEALEAICRRTQTIFPAGPGSTPRTRGRTASTSDPNLTLFALLVKNTDPESRPFLLESLEKFSSAALRTYVQELDRIHQALIDLQAPRAYIERFDLLRQKTRNVSQTTTAPNVQSGSRGRRNGRKADPKPGSKRTHTDVGTALNSPERKRRSNRK